MQRGGRGASVSRDRKLRLSGRGRARRMGSLSPATRCAALGEETEHGGQSRRKGPQQRLPPSANPSTRLMRRRRIHFRKQSLPSSLIIQRQNMLRKLPHANIDNPRKAQQFGVKALPHLTSCPLNDQLIEFFARPTAKACPLSLSPLDFPICLPLSRRSRHAYARRSARTASTRLLNICTIRRTVDAIASLSCLTNTTGLSKKGRLGCVNLPLIHATLLVIFGQPCTFAVGGADEIGRISCLWDRIR